MAPRFRKMQPYHPRKRGKRIDLQKRTLRDLENKISLEISSLILQHEAGNEQQIQTARIKAKSGYLKYSDEMQKIAQHMGDPYVKLVRDFLDSVDSIVHSNSTWIDEAKVRNCYNMTQKLENEIRVA